MQILNVCFYKTEEKSNFTQNFTNYANFVSLYWNKKPEMKKDALFKNFRMLSFQ